MAQLFDVSTDNVGLHLKNIFEDGELEVNSVTEESSVTAADGKNYLTILFADDRYKLLRDRCNDHTHYNFYKNVLLNNKDIFLEERQQALEEFSNDLRDVLTMHLAYMFFANGHYMMSSDYMDYLECGMTPEQDSQYWVAPFVQEIFDQTIKMSRPDIADMIKHHSSMHLA